jgi:hypothetical protein
MWHTRYLNFKFDHDFNQQNMCAKNQSSWIHIQKKKFRGIVLWYFSHLLLVKLQFSYKNKTPCNYGPYHVPHLPPPPSLRVIPEIPTRSSSYPGSAAGWRCEGSAAWVLVQSRSRFNCFPSVVYGAMLFLRVLLAPLSCSWSVLLVLIFAVLSR